MLTSHGYRVVRIILPNLRNLRQIVHQPIRQSGNAVWTYRRPTEANPSLRILAEAIGGFMWWWIFWHLWHEPGHIVGEFPYPDPSQWTDEELGIPPDDED